MKKFIYGTALLLVQAPLMANPEGGKAISGEISFQLDNEKLLIIDASDKSVIEWNSFSLKADDITKFIQPTTTSLVLNRVIEAYPSEIFGKIEANGQVLLINPHGVLVGKEAQINTGSWIASTLDVNTDLFLATSDLQFEGNSENSVINDGSLIARDGDLFLIGKRVEQRGSMEAKGHLAGTIGASSVLLKADGANRLYVRTREATKDIQNPFSNAFSTVDGKITNPGGSIYILGDTVAISPRANLDVSSDFGGGQIFVGGDYQGQNPDLMNATWTFIEKGASLHADALQSGDGGRVIVWASADTAFEGNISARGAGNGKGGFAEVSGRRNLQYLGLADLRDQLGGAGMLLLDPTEITIGGVPTGTVVLGVCSFPITTYSATTGAPSILATAALTGSLAGSNMQVTTFDGTSCSFAGTGDLTVKKAFPISWAAPTSLALDSAHDLFIEDSIKPGMGMVGPQIILRAVNDILIGVSAQVTTLDVETLSGDIFIQAGGNITIGHPAGAGGITNVFAGSSMVNGNLTINSGNTLTIQGAPVAGGAVTVQSYDTEMITATAAINIFGGPAGGTDVSIITHLGPQIFTTNNFTMISNKGSAFIAATGNQSFFTTGFFQMTQLDASIFFPRIEYSADQFLQAGAFQMDGGTIRNMATNQTQTIIVTGRMILQGGWDAANMLNINNVINANSSGMDNSQHITVGAQLHLLAFQGVSAMEGGSCAILGGQDNNPSSIDVGRDLVLLAGSGKASGGGRARISSGPNTTHSISGDLLLLSPSPFDADQAQINISGLNYSLTVNRNVEIGSAAGFGSTQIICDDINCSIGGNLTIQGGTSGLLGDTANIQQDIGSMPLLPMNIAIGGDLRITGGSGALADAFIATSGPTLIRVGRDAFITGGSGMMAQGFWVSQQPINPTSMTLQVGRDLVVRGGAAPFGFSPGYILGPLATLSVSAGRDITLIGGTLTATNHALIGGGWDGTYGFPDTSSTTIQAFGNFLMQNNASGSLAYLDTIDSGITLPFVTFTTNGSISVFAKGDITFSTRLRALDSPGVAHSLTIDADHAFAAGALWSGGFPFGSPSAAMMKTSNGGFKVDTAPLVTGISLTSVAGPIYLSSGEHFANTTVDDLIIGPIATTNNLTLTSGTGNITVDPFHNISITNGVVTGGSVLIIAQNIIDMTATGFITAGGSVQLVTDNQAPAAPLIGLGGFQMVGGAFITAGGPLRIFTAIPSQNSILGLLNGNPFVAGTFLQNSATEFYCTYFPAGIQGVPYTIFYKPCLQLVAQQALRIISEMFYDLDQFDGFWGWEEEFFFVYNYKEPALRSKTPYYMRRRVSPVFDNPKTWTTIVH